MRPTLFEAASVLLAGLVFALGANALSPRGLSLGRNYFPGATRPRPITVVSNAAPTLPGVGTNTAPSADAIAARLKEKGLQVCDSNQVAQFFHDPRTDQETIIFVDARDDRSYKEGHIPGAYQLDHYHPDQYLAPVLGACQSALTVVVYCTGGNCEDSEFAALMLAEAGVPREKLWVYPGGFAQWATNGLPVELEARKSGQLKEGPK
jgi:rhodanese-related sulfurtransferase